MSRRDRPLREIDSRDCLIIGFAQALALVPGVSRSGATISAGLLRNFDRAAAARYSFLLSVPAVVLSGLFELRHIGGSGQPGAGAAVLATLLAFVVGYASIAWLLRWLRRFIALRKEHPVFGVGSFEALTPGNPKIFACIRTYEDDVVLCVHNLARSAQAVELDLSWYKGRRPVELFGRSRFPKIGELPYLLTLAPRGFFWFRLEEVDDESS